MAISAESREIAQSILALGQDLSSGERIPAVGFGTWQMPNSPECAKAVCHAIEYGYRLIDGAAIYGNEVAVGKGIKAALAAGVSRSDLFLTSKVWISSMGYQKTMDAFFKTLNDLDVDYLDLYLIHWPCSPTVREDWSEVNLATWKAMVELYEEGHIKSIGVSNFKEQHLQPLLDYRVKPMVNQIELHPGFSQAPLRQFCEQAGIVVESWGPLGQGRVLEHPLLNELANKHGCTVAQLCLRFILQLGVVSLPKSVNPNRIQANLDFFDFTLSDEEMQQILALDAEKLGFSGLDSDTNRPV